MKLFLIILGALALSGILMYILLAVILYTKLLVRTSAGKWGRECSISDDEEQRAMYDAGEKWLAAYADKKTDVEITNEGYRLAGEYVDFGCDKAVIIIAGRTEACHYCYYFAEPYRKAGCNVLVIDNRAHGLSSGKCDCLGLREYTDIIAWSKLLHDKLGNAHVMCHGICIGSATALNALISPLCPPYLEGLVADGMYTNFMESFDNHLKERKHGTFPTSLLVRLIIRIIAGKDIVKYGPLNRIGLLQKPILFIYSRQDTYSVPQKSQLLLNACRCNKRVEWFDKGAHSRVRINNIEGYDAAVVSFVTGLFKQA